MHVDSRNHKGEAAETVVAEKFERGWCFGPELWVRAKAEDPVSVALEQVFGAFARPQALSRSLTQTRVEREWEAKSSRSDLTLESVRDSDGAWRLLSGGLTTFRLFSLSELAPLIEGAVLGWAVRNRNDCAPLHGAAVLAGDDAVLLLGDKGCGKSTLAVCLAEQGCDFLGDELALLAFEDNRLEPFPKAATIKAGAFHLFPELSGANAAHVDPVRGPLQYWGQGARHDPGARRAVRSLVLPRWSPTAGAPRAVPVSAEQVVLELVRQCFGGLERDVRTFSLVCALSKVPAYAIEFSDARMAAEALRIRFDAAR